MKQSKIFTKVAHAMLASFLGTSLAVANVADLKEEFKASHVFRAPDSALHDARGWMPDKKGFEAKLNAE